MTILALECSCAVGSVAILSGREVLAEQTFETPRGRGTALFPALEAMLHLARPEAVVVGTGPGSYNGLRAALAVAWGISRGLGIACHGVPSVLGFDATDYTVLGDARAGQLFVARVRGGRLDAEPFLCTPREAVDVAGTVFSVSAVPGIRATPAMPQARVLAGRREAFGAPVPIYLKPPHITTSRRPSPWGSIAGGTGSDDPPGGDGSTT